jgi:pseudaminic acid biosynthesis-associated methylase
LDNKFQTEQEIFWAGEFGDNYVSRHQGGKKIAATTNMFAKILPYTISVKSIIEFGANVGLNLHAIKRLLPECELSGVEINEDAIKKLQEANFKFYHDSILEFKLDYQRDMSLIKGVLIHINPERLNDVYDLLYKASSRYICVIEYYNPTPVEVEYQGHQDRLFKRDFAGEIMDRFPDLQLVDYGFIYHRDNNFPKDDANWFLMEKR